LGGKFKILKKYVNNKTFENTLKIKIKTKVSTCNNNISLIYCCLVFIYLWVEKRENIAFYCGCDKSLIEAQIECVDGSALRLFNWRNMSSLL
jgi:hypothetical protein